MDAILKPTLQTKKLKQKMNRFPGVAQLDSQGIWLELAGPPLSIKAKDHFYGGLALWPWPKPHLHAS